MANYNHTQGCTKCTVTGEYYAEGHHMSYPNIDAPRRTDTSFRSRTDSEHHKNLTPLENLPINMIDQFPIADSLHLLDLGIMRRCLYGWVFGSFNFRTKWSNRQIQNVSQLLVQSNLSITNDFHRVVRPLDCLKLWKGTEYRTFLLYLGIVILRDFLNQDIYEHFLLLFCSVRIYFSRSHSKYFTVAHAMIKNYIQSYISIYGIDSISSNVHNLIHIHDDVTLFGDLQTISSYPFENHLNKIKRMLRGGKRPLAQVAKRLIESRNAEMISHISYSHNQRKNHVKPSPNVNSISVRDEFTLSLDEKNKWFLTNNNEIVGFVKAEILNKKAIIHGDTVTVRTDFFVSPIKSSYLDIYLCPKIVPTEKNTYFLESIKCKLLRLPYNNDFVFIPIVHTF